MKFEWDADNPIERNRHESRRASAALRDYAQMGPARSLRALGAQYANRPLTEKPPTRYWKTLAGWSKRFSWQARVAHWEKLEQEREEAEYREERRAWRHKRRQAVGGAFARVAQALAGADVEGLPFDRVARAMAIVFEELRKEYGDEVTRLDVTSGGERIKGYCIVSPDDWDAKDEQPD